VSTSLGLRAAPKLLGCSAKWNDTPVRAASEVVGTVQAAAEERRADSPPRADVLLDDPVRVLVTGSRSWGSLPVVRAALAQVIAEHPGRRIVVVHGNCRTGADAIAKHLATRWGPLVSEEPHPAKWTVHGSRRAGPERNKEMVEAGAHVCLAFIDPCSDERCRRAGPHDSHGTAGCVELARAADIPVRPFRREEEA
jgi:hypothetical protein